MKPHVRWLSIALAIVMVFVIWCGATPTPAQSQAAVQPGIAAQQIRSGLFDAQSALLAGDTLAAERALSKARAGAELIAPRLTADPEIVPALNRQLASAGAAVAQGDATDLAIASGSVWSTLVHGAYSETLQAITKGNPDDAATWLLLRDFRPTTRFDRPGADATMAINGLQRGTVTADQALATVQADLLDTYQSRVEVLLNALTDARPEQLTPTQAQAIGEVTGYWPMLAPALGTQFGASAQADADTTFAALRDASRSGATPSFAAAQQRATEIIQSFRAAPLTDTETARRAGQLLRYLSLIPVEYGRGIKQGEVLHELELREAVSFMAGSQAAFNDLRLPLRQRDPAATAELEASLTRLNDALQTTVERTSVTAPGTIAEYADDVTRQLNGVVPKEWLNASGDSDFDIVGSLLDQMVAAQAAGEYQQAESARIEAYAIFETGPEKRLLAFTPDAALRVERLFWEGDGATTGLYRQIANQASVSDLRASRRVLDTELGAAQAALQAGSAPAAIVFNAATLVFREGLEAILILASLLASMIGANRQFKRPLVIGALSALAVTAILFILVQSALLSVGQHSEQIAAVVSILAIGVLLLVMNWFFHKVYWTKWIAKHHEQRRRLLIGGVTGQAIGFIILGFTSVFREGAETVLFLQALVLEAGTRIVVEGVALGLAAVLVVGILTLKLQTKLPHKKMLMVTGVMIALVLVTMVGQTVHTLQLIGWMPISPVPGAERWPFWIGVWFGVYGTWQGMFAQALAIAFVFGSYFLAEWQHERSRGKVRATMQTA